jgi:PEP-CTERM motif
MKAFLAVIFAASLSISPALASVITIDFENQTPAFVVTENLTISGFRFSPNFHYDLVDARPLYQSQWIGFDGAGPRPNNPNFLGPTGPPPSLWIDYSGGAFALSGLDAVSLGSSHWRATSSNGGDFTYNSGSFGHVGFSGAEWRDVTWLLFTHLRDFGAPQGFDNIALNILEHVKGLPEPSTVVLIGLGLAFLAITRRKRRSR